MPPWTRMTGPATVGLALATRLSQPARSGGRFHVSRFCGAEPGGHICATMPEPWSCSDSIPGACRNSDAAMMGHVSLLMNCTRSATLSEWFATCVAPPAAKEAADAASDEASDRRVPMRVCHA